MACRFEVTLDSGDARHVDAARAALDEVDAIEASLTVVPRHERGVAAEPAGGDGARARSAPASSPCSRSAASCTPPPGAPSTRPAPPSRAAGGSSTGGRACPRTRRSPRPGPAPAWTRSRSTTWAARSASRSPASSSSFGAVGKGWALDRVAASLRVRGVARALLTAGGSSHRGWGGESWELALRPGGEDLGLLRLRDAALGTSAAGEQHFEADGRRFGHVLDPRTRLAGRGRAQRERRDLGGRGGRRPLDRLPRRAGRPSPSRSAPPGRARWRSSSSTRSRARSASSGSATASRSSPRTASGSWRRPRERRDASRGTSAQALAAVAEPERAAPMQAYAKSSMPYLGVTAVPLRRVCREVFAGVDLPTAAAWRRAVLGLWRGARYREERYGAIELTGVKRFDRFQDMAALPMYEEMIVTGAWWDLRGRDRRPPPRPPPAPLPARDAEGDAGLEPLGRPLEAPQRHPLPAHVQEGRPTSTCSTPRSSPRSPRRSSSCGRPSAGRCGSTPGRTRRRSAGTSASTRRSSAPLEAGGAQERRRRGPGLEEAGAAAK